jgi:glycosyltransferase involved in cell wall biosynthesis
MNILIVTAMFPPIRTGTSFYSKNLAYTFHNQGHQVNVVTLENNEAKNENYPFPVDRLKAIHINTNNYFKHLRVSSIFISNYKNLLKVAKENRIDVVLLVNHYLDIAFPAIYATSKLKIPLFISVGTQMQSLNPFKNRILILLDKIICGKLIFPYCRKIISWDTEIERYINKVQKRAISIKSVIIPFGVNGDVSQYSNYQHDYSNLHQIIGVGAIISQRDYLFHLRVFKELLISFPDLKFKIIGHIYNCSALKLADELGIQERVVFTGELPHEQVLLEMKNSAIHWMMLSGGYVGLGTATIEAMLLGIPCISNVPENLLGEPLLKDMKNYIFTDGINIFETSHKIKNLLLSETIRKEVGTEGRGFVKRNLDWDIVGKKMARLFEENSHLNTHLELK